MSPCPTGSDREGVKQFAKCGFRPAFSVVARPSFFKMLPAGRFIGYDATYQTTTDEWIANFTTGWSDGLSRRLSNGIGAIKRLKTGESAMSRTNYTVFYSIYCIYCNSPILCESIFYLTLFTEAKYYIFCQLNYS